MSLIKAAVKVNVLDWVRFWNSICTKSSLSHSLTTQYGDSVLIMAVKCGRAGVVSLLIEAGANTDLQNNVK